MFVDCTLRDGGYYNAWDFSADLIDQYLEAMQATGVDVVEVGFRSLNNSGFKGACAFASDEFLCTLSLPERLAVGVMINGHELVGEVRIEEALSRLFPVAATESPVDVVRIACHLQEFEKALPAVNWLKGHGYRVGFNLMQVSDCSENEIRTLAKLISAYPVDVLYFADSMGSMTPDDIARLVKWLRNEWHGPIGIHTHDNMGLALQNTLRAMDEGVTWVDSTVTGMGRGAGNARTEELAIELAEQHGQTLNMVLLMSVIRKHFRSMQKQYGWGANTYYYLAGKYGIHPTYIQEMLNDSRYDEEDVLAVIEHLRVEGGKKFSVNTLDSARCFYQGEPRGNWNPATLFKGREVLLLGSGPGVANHRNAIERYIKKAQPVVLALNTQSAIDSSLIDVRVACHPVRLLADCDIHIQLEQPLITPASMLPTDVYESLAGNELLDYGMTVHPGQFEFNTYCCVLPTSLVIAYALAVVSSGGATRALMAGFDGYGGDDHRTKEMQELLTDYQQCETACELLAITPTRYTIAQQSIYALRRFPRKTLPT